MEGHKVIVYSLAQDSSIVQGLTKLKYCQKKTEQQNKQLAEYRGIIEEQHIDLIVASDKLENYEGIISRLRDKEKLYTQAEQSCMLLKESYKQEAIDTQNKLQKQINITRGVAIGAGVTIVALTTAFIITSIQK